MGECAIHVHPILWGSIQSNQISNPNLPFRSIFSPLNLSPPIPISPSIVPIHPTISFPTKSPNPVPISSLNLRQFSPSTPFFIHFGMFLIIFSSHLALFLLIFLPSFEMLSNSSKFYALNLSALDEYWHRAAVMALLKLKAESLLSSLPPAERPIFLQCAKGEGGKTAKGLAKCVNSLIKQRDRMEMEGEMRRNEIGEQKMPESTMEGLMGMLKEAMENLVGTKRRALELEEEREEEEEDEQKKMKIALDGENIHFGGFMPGRQKRSTKGLVHVENLRELQRFLEMRQFCRKYLAKIAQKNSDLFRSHLPFGLRLRFDQFAQNGIGQQILSTIQNRPIFRRISLISPRLFSLLPEGHKSPFDRLLSPQMFSLSSTNDGFLPLANPKAGKLLNRILALSGAGRIIEKTLNGFEGEKRQLEEQIFPAVLELQMREKKWAKLMEPEQRKEMQEFGFSFLRKCQAELVFGKERANLMFNNEPTMSTTNPNKRHFHLEKAIHVLAHMDDKQSKNEENNGGNKVLAPFAFTNFVAEGVALESMILSPHAFISELLAPAALSAEILSPRAFVAAILSPNALFARILSPGAFRTEVLSPRALSPFVLSPEAMIAEVLSPRALEPHVLSPEMGIIKVLSPVFLSPRIISPEQLAIIILSPTILSPGVLSREQMVLEVLSPHILSGGSEEEEEEEIHEHEHGDEHEMGNEHVGGEQHGAIENKHEKGLENGEELAKMEQSKN